MGSCKPIPGCPVGFLCLCCVFCLSSFCVLYPMFTAAHSWLSRRFSLDTIHRTKTNKIHNTNIENRRDNQEWAAVNIGYNTQNEDPFLVVPSVFYVCVMYFVFLRSVYCIQCLQLPIPGCPVGFLCLCYWIQYTERRQTKYTTQT
jgi:hypothetical protein